MRIIKKGATSQSIYLEVLDSASSVGGRKTGIVFNSAGLTGYYVRNGASAAQITLATLTNPNSAWSSGGFKEVDATNMPGIYRLDVPDAAFATGAESVVITIKGASGMVQVSEEVQLVAVDLQDAVAFGLSRIDAAVSSRSSHSAADVWAAATRTLSSAGIQAVWDALSANLTTAESIGKRIVDFLTGDIFSRLGAPAGASVSADLAAVKTETAAIKGKTDNLPVDPADASDIAGAFSTVNSTLSTLAGYIDTEVAAIKAKTDLLPASPAATGDIPSASAIADAVWDEDIVAAHQTADTAGKKLSNSLTLFEG